MTKELKGRLVLSVKGVETNRTVDKFWSKATISERNNIDVVQTYQYQDTSRNINLPHYFY